MAKPIVVTISHHHGAQEARRRIREGLEKAQKEFSGLLTADVKWSEYHADIVATAVKQTVTTALDVFDESVRVELQLPWYFAPFQAHIVAMLEDRGQKLLAIAPPPKSKS